MESSEKSNLDALKNFFEWAKNVEPLEEEMEDFESEISDFNEKAKFLLKDYFDSSIDYLELSVFSTNEDVLLFVFVYHFSNFSANMSAYYNWKIQYENAKTEFSDNIAAANKDFTLDSKNYIIDEQLISYAERFNPLQKIYTLKLNDMLEDFKARIKSLKQEFIIVKKDFDKLVQ